MLPILGLSITDKFHKSCIPYYNGHATEPLTPPRPQDQLDKFKAGHAATLHDLRVPEKNAELHSLLSFGELNKRRRSAPFPATRASPPPSTSSAPEKKRDDVFLKLLRDIVGHLLMPQKQNYEEELCVMVS